MALYIPRHPLTAARQLAAGVTPQTKVVTASELIALREGEKVVAEALAQADSILAGAQAAFEAERKRGFQEGQEEARLEQAEQMIDNVSRTIDYFSKVETRMVDLVMQAVQKIVGDFDDTERVLHTVRNVLSVVRNQKQMTLRLNPQQVDTVKSHVNDLLAAYPGVGYLDIVPDHRVALDACILESDIGIVEASMEGQLKALRSAFQKVLGSRI
jgi:type III secretion protein L